MKYREWLSEFKNPLLVASNPWWAKGLWLLAILTVFVLVRVFLSPRVHRYRTYRDAMAYRLNDPMIGLVPEDATSIVSEVHPPGRYRRNAAWFAFQAPDSTIEALTRPLQPISLVQARAAGRAPPADFTEWPAVLRRDTVLAGDSLRIYHGGAQRLCLAIRHPHSAFIWDCELKD